MKNQFVFNGRFLTKRPTGVDRFAFESLHALDKLVDEEPELFGNISLSLTVPANGVKVSPFKNIPIRYRGKTKGAIWEQFELPIQTSGKQLINLCNAAPMFKHKQTVVIHDATPLKFPETFSFLFRCWYRFLMPVIGKLAKQVCTVSEFSKKEITDNYGIAFNKIKVISESGEHIRRFVADESILTNYGLRKRAYILAVSSTAPHKNFKIIFEAFKHIKEPPFDVVIAGGVNPQVFAHNNEQLPEYVNHVGYVTDGELMALMANARWFVFPSIYEGFGIPPLEAMSCGCPVLASNAASIPEICGDAALYFDPFNAVELANLLMDVSNQPDLHDHFVKKGRERAAEFTWNKAAYQLLKHLTETIS